jgi:uncharacterized membrane protein
VRDDGYEFYKLSGVTWIASGAPAKLLSGQTAIFKVGVVAKQVTTDGKTFTYSFSVWVDPSNWILESNEANNFKKVLIKVTGGIGCK